MRIGSLCSGYGGLDLAVHDVLGGELAWVADNDSGAATILAHRFPSVPNHGDIRATDWNATEPVDILTAGFPCQPVSAAGKRKGLSDERWLFDDITEAIGRMVARPGLLVFENVAGLLSANGGDAMARVVQGLAALGYVGRYGILRASDAGAPHGRARVFIVARLAADARGERQHRWPRIGRDGWPSTFGEQAGGDDRDGDSASPANAAGVRLPLRRAEHLTGSGGAAAAPDRRDTAQHDRLPDQGSAPAADPDGTPSGERRLATPGQAPRGRPHADARGRGGAPAADARGAGLEVGPVEPHRDERQATQRGRGDDAPADADGRGRGAEPWLQRGLRPAEHQPGDIAWGAYEPAIRRWESVLGRAAPRPTEPGRTGQRLSPAFVEWMQGLPDGWVTGVPGLGRKDQLHALGNGVVPQQAAMALRLLLDRADISSLAADRGAA